MTGSSSGKRRLLLRWLSTLVLLGLVLSFLEPAALADRVQELLLWPAVLAIAVSVLQVVASAWRWRYTAERLGLPLALPQAVREYYLGTFLNQVLPGGVAGDASRAWRHGRGAIGRGPALRAVMIERFSGQVVLAVLALVSVVSDPSLRRLLDSAWNDMAWQLALPVALAGLVIVVVHRLSPSSLQAFGRDISRALFSWPAFVWQWLSSILIILTYLLVFLLAARVLGIDRPALEVLPLVPLILLAMLLPISVAGWGLREGAAALVWASVGWPPEEGVVIAVTYGVLVLLASLPGVLVLTGLACTGAASAAEESRAANRA